VDGMLIVEHNAKTFKSLKNEMSKALAKNLGLANQILGMRITRD